MKNTSTVHTGNTSTMFNPGAQHRNTAPKEATPDSTLINRATPIQYEQHELGKQTTQTNNAGTART